MARLFPISYDLGYGRAVVTPNLPVEILRQHEAELRETLLGIGASDVIIKDDGSIEVWREWWAETPLSLWSDELIQAIRGAFMTVYLEYFATARQQQPTLYVSWSFNQPQKIVIDANVMFDGFMGFKLLQAPLRDTTYLTNIPEAVRRFAGLIMSMPGVSSITSDAHQIVVQWAPRATPDPVLLLENLRACFGNYEIVDELDKKPGLRAA